MRLARDWVQTGALDSRKAAYKLLSGQYQGSAAMGYVRSALGLVFAGFMSLPATAQQITWTAGFVNAIGSSYVETIKTVPARIDAARKGGLECALFDQLVAGPEQPAAVRDGRLDSSFAVSPWLSAEAPYMNFGHLPGLLTDVGVYPKTLAPMLRGEMAKTWQAKYNAVQLATGVFEEQ